MLKLIKPSSEVVGKAIIELNEYKEGKKVPVKTRYHHLNTLTYGGLLPNMMVVIGGVSGTGKSYIAQTIEEDFLDPLLNPGAENHILLRCSWEMVIRSLLVRAIRREIPLTIKDIYYAEKTPEQQRIIDEIFKRESASNIYYMTESPTPIDFKTAVTEFLREHKDKKHILVSIDHMGLVNKGNKNKFDAVNELTAIINEINVCGEFDNVTWLPLMQMNRGIEDRTDVRHLAPRRGDIYGTDEVYQLSSLLIILHRPEKLHHDVYMQFNPSKYPHLKKYMKNPSANSTNFTTRNLMFWHYLKIREDDETMQEVYVEEISKKVAEEIRKEYEAKKTAEVEKENNDSHTYSRSELKDYNKDDLPF